MQPSRLKQTSILTSQSQDPFHDLDPLLQNGYKPAFIQPRFALQIRSIDQNNTQISLKQLVQLRILTLSTNQGIVNMKIEISTQQDLFRTWVCGIDQQIFGRMAKSKHLNFGYQSLLGMLVKQLQLCQRSLNQFMAVFYVNRTLPHRLQLLQNIQYKRIQLLSLQFGELNEQEIRQYVSYRFSKMKVSRGLIEKKLSEVMSVTRIKNMGLWSQIVKRDALMRK